MQTNRYEPRPAAGTFGCDQCRKQQVGERYVVGLGKMICEACKREWDRVDREQMRPEMRR